MIDLRIKRIISLILLMSLALLLSPTVNKIYASTGTTRAIGDLQGDIDALNEILTKSGSVDHNGDLRSNLTLIFVGDLIGSGPNSPAVIQRVMELHHQAQKVNSEVIIVAGNHEINLLNNRYHAISKEDKKNWAAWLDPDSHWQESIYNSLHFPISANRNTSILREFYSLLRPWYKTQNLLFVHAGISQKMLKGLPPTFTDEFRSQIRSVLDGSRFISPNDWFFSVEGPTLTSRTADPNFATFLLETPIESDQLDEFFKTEQLDQVIVGHWSTQGKVSYHSIFKHRILHIDTGISLSDGALSYVDFDSEGQITAFEWQKGQSINRKQMPSKSCKSALNGSPI